jgi:uncharacterized protein YjbI with pentapeptide repeats
MANEEHLEIFWQGVKMWNQWREDNPEITPDLFQSDLRGRELIKVDLSNADLSHTDLGRANLSGADLSGANLSSADLRQANLSSANLRQANFSNANLVNANLRYASINNAILVNTDLRQTTLREVDFSGADLSGKDLSGVNLIRANLSNANLSGAILVKAILGEANFSNANLRQAHLHEANLSNANLNNVNLSGAVFGRAIVSNANLSGAILVRADLSKASFSKANLSNANLSGTDLSRKDLSGKDLSKINLTLASLHNTNLQTARLINAKLDGANLTGAWLWETQRAGWSIKGVICDYAYWDKDGKEKTEYAPGEFERLFAEQTKIRLFYKDGISPLEIATLPALIQHLASSYPECSLRFVSIHEDSGGAVVELAIEDTEHSTSEQITQLQTALQTEAQAKVEYQRQALIERDTRLQLEGEVKRLDLFVDKLLLQRGDTYNFNGQVGAAGRNAQTHHNTFNQHVNHFEQSIDLSALAKELSELRQAIAKQESSPQTAIALGRIAEAELAASEKDTPKVIEHLKSAGIWTLDFARDMGKDVVAEAIRQAMGMG